MWKFYGKKQFPNSFVNFTKIKLGRSSDDFFLIDETVRLFPGFEMISSKLLLALQIPLMLTVVTTLKKCSLNIWASFKLLEIAFLPSTKVII